MFELGTGEYTLLFELYFPSASIDHPQLTYQPKVVLRHFAGYQLINLLIIPARWFIYTSTIM